MSFFYNIPRSVVERNKHIFATITDNELTFVIDHITMRMWYMYDDEQQISVYYHPCNCSPLFDVFRYYFERNLSPEDLSQCYGS